ncbi:ilvB operon leader peptide IvbL [Pectobacterium brasiliense]|uniref:IlvB operon leader peptide IvbL n=1 Tax=Pectobacterium brasiliense TaxID=180957 RepID=A0AAE2WFZ3_9GAMM|nr:ilvB operon leader peptide IvbL [Pectobacterium brasiliense]MBA0214918.1 ilvB operon leader peptide IvbL [Pectobacterium brasiliense]MBN3052664.1 ilvB operon leader peptide IvbL [Pectobacterium brasiliense]MBN3094741.1 ilvB operon leader peptide IvbL [Pectobacterium brasiliense]MBN3116202.1 ilvB operon leader peptide IvbL [Pectobacterium brasiliense]
MTHYSSSTSALLSTAHVDAVVVVRVAVVVVGSAP